jgi:ATP-dependent RNA helicase DDX55/SPB4
LFIAPHEDTYVELIKGRGVPLVELDKSELQTQYNNDNCNNINNSSTSNNDSSINKRLPPCPFLADLKKLVMEDRALLEAGTNAFISFLRAYKENLCSYIFRLDQLDIGSVARAYALLKLPKIPETQSQRKGSKKPVDFEATDVNTGTIPFKHKEREDARQRKYKEKLEAEKEERENGPKVVAKSSVGNSNTTKPSKKDASEDDPNNKKRKRKKKQSFTQKLKEEWDDLAAEEAAFRKFKRGKLSRVAYEGCLMDADANADAINTLMDTKGTSKKSKKRKTSRKYDSDDNSDDDDSDDDGSESD